MSIKLNANEELFIIEYSKNVSNVSSSELRQFLEQDLLDTGYEGLDMGSHMMDCWSLWNAAREPLIRDLRTALEHITSQSDNLTVISNANEFNIEAKMKEVGLGWGIVPLRRVI